MKENNFRIALFMVGVTFLLEAIIFAVLFNYASPALTQPALIIGWGYALVKMAAGIASVYFASRK